MEYERKSKAGKHKDEAHAALVLNLKIAREAMDLVQDWERSWPNDITNLPQRIESTINDIRVFQRQVQPATVESNPQVARSGEPFDQDGDVNIIKVQDDQ